MAARLSSPGFWNKLTTRERVIMVTTLLCALSALIYKFPYAMLEKRADTLQANIASAEQEIQDLSLRFAALRNQSAPQPATSAGWELADQKSAILLLEDVSGEARHVGVNLVSIHPSQEVDKKKYTEMAMNLDLKGRYRQLAEYFKRLESLPKIVNIRKIRLESCSDSSSVCSAQVEAVTYLAK